MDNSNIPDPVDYPLLTIGGKEYELKLRQYDVLQLLKNGVDIFNLPKIPLMSGEGIQRNLKLLQAAIAHQEEVSIEDLSKQLDFALVGQIEVALGESIKKAAAQIQAAFPLPEPTSAVQ